MAQDSQPRVGKRVSTANHRVPPWLLWNVHREITTGGFKELKLRKPKQTDQ